MFPFCFIWRIYDMTPRSNREKLLSVSPTKDSSQKFVLLTDLGYLNIELDMGVYFEAKCRKSGIH